MRAFTANLSGFDQLFNAGPSIFDAILRIVEALEHLLVALHGAPTIALANNKPADYKSVSAVSRPASTIDEAVCSISVSS
jgi:hypothetical protein